MLYGELKKLSMATLTDRDFDSMADYLLQRAREVSEIALPVDLFDLAKLQRVTAVDLRPMLPTGGLSCEPSGFVIYLQDLARSRPFSVPTSTPVQDRPQLTVRQRFSLAHELGHTLMFSKPPQLRADSPRGAKLEALCHRAARRVLMPQSLVMAEIHKYQRIGSSEILSLAKLFDVSTEVALWRCDDLPALRGSNHALLYIRRSASRDEIAGFFCSKWFEDRKGRPALGMSPVKWLSGFVDQGFWHDPKASSTVHDSDGTIKCTRVPLGRVTHFVEVERLRPTL